MIKLTDREFEILQDIVKGYIKKKPKKSLMLLATTKTICATR